MSEVDSWPYKLSDYPPKYVEFSEKSLGFYGDDLLRHFEGMDETPDSVPVEVFPMTPGKSAVFEKDEETFLMPRIYLGEAWDEMAFDNDGEVFFQYQTGQQDEVAEKINYCRRMFRDQFKITAWSAGDEGRPSLSHYFMDLYDERDLATYKLAYGGK